MPESLLYGYYFPCFNYFKVTRVRHPTLSTVTLAKKLRYSLSASGPVHFGSKDRSLSNFTHESVVV